MNIWPFGGPFWQLSWPWVVLGFLLAVCLFGGSASGVQAKEPALPAGLQQVQDQVQEAPREPALTQGRGKGEETTDEPALPSGLEQGSGTKEPSLPSGLSSPTKPEPELPAGLAGESQESDDASGATGDREAGWWDSLDLPVYGYLEGRVGPRLQSDPVQSRDATLGEVRLQLQSEKYWDTATLDLTADAVLDGVAEEADLDVRQLRLTFSPLDSMDVRVGRQVLSWGTGDLIFINDLFPKDWVSFLIGRDEEYLKAPGNAVRIGWFTELVNVNLVYSPKFDPDRFITGERLSYWNPALGRIAGEDNEIRTEEPDDWFDDDELALRLYRNIAGTEVALYSSFGYWKSPAGQDRASGKAVFPRLNVYGASVQGTVGPGIGNVEVGYYDSREDQGGDDPFVNNSEVRVLVGYEQELATEFTGSVQYYLEHMLDYDDYRDNLPQGAESRDEDRHLLTLRLTKLLMNQDLTLSLFTFYSPSDQDAYLRPEARYELSDAWTVSTGGNLFAGEDPNSFFGQFEDNSNWYLSLRYAF